MPTRYEVDRAVREAVAETEAKIAETATRARRLRRLGVIDDSTEREMILSAGRPEHSDPEKFPHANRLKGQFA